MEKACKICKRVQPLTEFYRAKGTKDGHRGDCKDCFKERAARRYAADPDHDHASGALRGLLCFDCNAGPGKLREDPDLLRAAIDYLDAHDPETIELAALTRTRLAALCA